MKKNIILLLLFFAQPLLQSDDHEPLELSTQGDDDATTRSCTATQASKLQYFAGDVIIQDTLKVTHLYAQYATIGSGGGGGGGTGGNIWPLLSVPWTNWQYFVGVLSGVTASLNWVPSDSINGTGYAGGSSNLNFRTVNLDIETAGTYSFSFGYQAQSNAGIATFVINGVTTNIDTYNAFTTMESFTWTQVLAVGIYTIAFSSLTKNGDSTDYWLQLLGDGLAIRRVA